MAFRSPIRYPGGKWKVLDQLLPLIPDDIEDWREPFFGGGSVTMGLIQFKLNKPKRMLCGDLAPEVYNFWVGTQQDPAGVEKFAMHLYNLLLHNQFEQFFRLHQQALALHSTVLLYLCNNRYYLRLERL